MQQDSDDSENIKRPRHWYYTAWIAMFGVIVIGSLAELDIANGQYKPHLYTLCTLSLVLAFYSMIKHKFGELVNLIILLPSRSEMDDID